MNRNYLISMLVFVVILFTSCMSKEERARREIERSLRAYKERMEVEELLRKVRGEEEPIEKPHYAVTFIQTSFGENEEWNKDVYDVKSPEEAVDIALKWFNETHWNHSGYRMKVVCKYVSDPRNGYTGMERRGLEYIIPQTRDVEKELTEYEAWTQTDEY